LNPESVANSSQIGEISVFERLDDNVLGVACLLYLLIIYLYTINHLSMIENTCTHEANGLTTTQVWAAMTDLSSWSRWNPGVASARLISNDFVAGGQFELKPLAGPTVRIDLVSVEAPTAFTDCTSFPFAKMYGIHTHEAIEGGVRMTITMRLVGPLAWLWYRLVAKGIIEGLPAELVQLEAFCRSSSQA
jgi:Polyketide cyclase / dehydrase and lipid transport